MKVKLIVWISYLQESNTADKVTDVSEAVAKAIVDLCQCLYTPNLIIDHQLTCSEDKNLIIYQALLLSTDGKTAEQIRNLTQEWVLTKPTVNIDNKAYQLDSFCSIAINELGVIECDAIIEPTEPTANKSAASNDYTTLEEAFFALLILLVLVQLELQCVWQSILLFEEQELTY